MLNEPEFYLLINNVSHGPYTSEQIQDWIKSQSSETDLSSVFFAIVGSQKWQPISEFYAPSSSPVVPPPLPSDQARQTTPLKTPQKTEDPIGIVLKVALFSVLLVTALNFLPSTSTEQKKSPQTLSPKEEIKKQLSVTMKWQKGGFGAVMLADLFFSNDSPHTVNDIEIAVITYGDSNTRISRKKYVITQTIPPFSKKTVPEFNLGLINQQAVKASVDIVDFNFTSTSN